MSNAEAGETEGGWRVRVAPAPFEVNHVGDPLGVVLSLRGELDLATSPLLREHLDEAVANGQAVVIDLSGLEFIDSSGLRTLVHAQQQLRASGGQLVLLHGPRAVRRVFEVSTLDRYFVWSDSANAALSTALEQGNGTRTGADSH